MGNKRKRVSKKKSNSTCYVISVDVGIVNFAYTCLDASKMKILACHNKEVCKFKGSKDYVKMCDTVLDFFAEAIPRSKWDHTTLVIERQMKASVMRIFAVSLEVAWYHITGKRAVVISPIKVKRHFGTSTGRYKTNKNAAIALMPVICCKYPMMREHWLRTCVKNSKIDDIADSMIQSIYYIETTLSS